MTVSNLLRSAVLSALACVVAGPAAAQAPAGLPAALLGRLKGHVWNIHAKDNAPEGTAADERGFAILGKGTVNWDEVLPAARAAGVIFYTLEHDQPKDAALVLKEGNASLTARLGALLARWPTTLPSRTRRSSVAGRTSR